MKKTATMKIGNQEYAKVKDRLKEFRENNPNGLIETFPTIEDTYLMFKVRILKDKSNPDSAEATAHSYIETGEKNKDKFFEKQESIAVGRALALLGYGADGEIASSEEMEEFLAEKQAKLADAIMEATEAIGNCETEAELKKLWASLGAEMQKHVLEAKEAKKVQLHETN